MRITIRTGNEAGHEFSITKEMTVGRAAENEVVLTNADVSSYHARLTPRDGGVELTDSGSRNGTFVNGERLSAPVTLRGGEELRFGNTVTAVVGEEATSVPGAALANSLVVRTGNDTGRSVTLPANGAVTIGRDASCTLVLNDPRVSSRHAEVRLSGSGVVVADLGSANGTLVNGQQISGPTSAPDGAEIQVGETVLIYYREGRTSGFVSQPTIVGSITPSSTAAVASAVEARAAKKSRKGLVIGGGIAAALVVGGGATAAILASGGDDKPKELTVADLADLRRDAVVHILNLDDYGKGSQGSGSVIDAEDGLIVTNNHVATGGNLFVLNENIKKPVDAKLIGAAPCEDLAVIQVVKKSDRKTLTEVLFGKTSTLRQGQVVVAMGFPASAESGTGERLDSLSTTSGIISKSDTVYDSPGDVPKLAEAIQHQAAVNPGNSGGPLFDLFGNQVGVNTAIFFIDGRGRAEGENYAIAADRVEDVIRDLKRGSSPKWIGTAFGIATDSQGRNAGLIIEAITPGSPAEEAELQVDDIILSIDGKDVFDLHSYCDAMPEEEGTTATFTILTVDDDILDIDVVVGTKY